MDYKAMAAAIKLCGSTPNVEHCKECPYWDDGDMNKCIQRMTADAATAIIDLLARAETAEARLAKAQEELDKMEQLHEDARRELGEANARADRSKWISVDDHLPPEHESIFKKLIDEEKWRKGVEGMWQSESDDVIVSVRFADGTKKTGQARTKDGHWTGLPTIGCPIVTHWRPFPKPYNGKEGQREG